jgi:hypothetical protein
MIMGFSIVTDSMTFTESNEVATSPSTNLGTMQPTEVWQTTNTTAWVQVDLGSSVQVKGAGLLYAAATSATNIQYRADDTDPTTTPTYDSGVVSHALTGTGTAWDRIHWVDWDSSGHTLRYHRFDITGSLPNAFYRAGRMLLILPYEPILGAQFGDIELGWIEQEFQLEGYGPRYPRQFPRYRYIEFGIHSNSKAEIHANAFAIDQVRGRSKDVFIWLDPDETAYPHQQMIYGNMTEMGPIEYVSGTATSDTGFWRKRWRVEELL